MLRQANKIKLNKAKSYQKAVLCDQKPSYTYSRRYQIFWEVVGLEWGPLSLSSTSEETLGRHSGGSGLEYQEYGRGDPLYWPRNTPLSAKVVINLADEWRSLGRYSSLAD
jgi:hypothetical protein